MNGFRRIATAAIVAAALAAPAAAQQRQPQQDQTYSAVSPADIQRLQDNVNQAAGEVQALRTRDAGRASQLQSQLDDLRDEVIYLKVKLRKEGLQRAEYAGVRDRIDDLRSQATSYAPAVGANGANGANGAPGASRAAAAPPAPAAAPARARETRDVEVPSGTEIDVRLQTALDSGKANVEDRFEATSLMDVAVAGKTVIPGGSVFRGVVSSVEPATRTNRTAKMTVSFDQVTVNGRAYPIHGTVTQAIQGEGIKGDTGKIAASGIGGAVLGGILGGAKGAVLGAVIGAGGIEAATPGKQIEMPQGSVLRVRLDSPVSIATAAAR
jgi:hypothetical protein